MKKKQKRDMQASSRTLSYFLTTRGGKPTTVKQASRALRVPASRLHNMVANFAKTGQLQRLDRGLYAAPTGTPVKVPKQFTLDEFLAELIRERDSLNVHIERVQHVIELRKQRGPK